MFALPVPLVHAGESSAESAPEPTEGQRALARAAESGSRVEVTGERSERTTVFANPDGFTFTLEQSAVPVRVAKEGGGWQAPDPTLERRSDGSVRPRAASVSMTFAGGPGDPLVTIADRGRSLQLDWSHELPEPQLDGASAVYKNVLPDVDLKVTATVESFQQVLVVRTPEAAADPRLKKLTFALDVKALKIQQGAAGNLAAVDAEGRTVFRAPPARMWDSAGATAAGPPATSKPGAPGPGTARSAVAGEPATGEPAAGETPVGDPSEKAASGSGLAPGQGDNISPIGVEIAKGSLSVVPDPGMLTDTDDSAYPVFIDPTVTWGESERTLLRSDGYESYGWGNGDDDQGQGVGKCGTWGVYYCGPGYAQRLYYEFSPASLKGKNVLGATFRVTEPWAFQCDPRWVDLVRTNNISASTTWSSRPADLDLMVDRNVSAGRGSLCDPDTPDAPVDFKDNAEESNENLTPTVRNFAAGKFSRLTLMLKAHDEGDTAAWKRFKNDAVLVVTYVGMPALPKDVGLVAGTGILCDPSSTTPSTVSDPTPLVTGRPMTVSGGSTGASLRIRWRTEKLSGTTWSPAITDVDSPTSGYVGNQVAQNRSLATLSEGVLYRLKALTLSFDEAGSNRLNTGYTAPCYFKVDPTAPKAPVVIPVAGSEYTLCATTCLPGGGPNVKGGFTFAPAAGDTDIVAYQYKQSRQTVWSGEIAGSTVQRDIVPTDSGTYQLEVRAKDKVGRWGASQIVSFLVREGDGPVGRWHFDEAGGQAVDSSTALTADQDNATLSAGAARDGRGRRGELWYDDEGNPLDTPKQDQGMVLNGTSGYAATSGQVLETRSAYSFSSWVRLDSKAADGVLLSQDGAHYSPFVTWYDVAYDSWCFGQKEKDETTGSAYFGLCGTQKAKLNAWTHVAGSYDPATQSLALYINGRLQNTRTVAGGWSATGPLQIGRYKWNDVYQHYFRGSIDEVAVWQRVLSADEVAKEARTLSTKSGLADVELVARWTPDGATGSTLADTASGYGRSLALAGGALLDGSSLSLDGVDDSATTAGPVLDDDGSFTVTSAVELDRAALLAKDIGFVGQVAGQRTADGSSWGLWFELTGRETKLDDEDVEYSVPVGFWRFGRVDKDGTGHWVSSDEAADLGSPVRLTGVFDAQDESAGAVARLYVGLQQNDMDMAYTSLTGSGDFAIGKGYSATSWSHYLPARIEEVRLWAGAMTGSDQLEAVLGD